jgi:hypothetical protein
LANIPESEVRSYLKAASAAGRAQGGAAQVAQSQAPDGADADRDGAAAPTGAGASVDAPAV